jgi:polar amino acid transport system substrate-binding protein
MDNPHVLIVEDDTAHATFILRVFKEQSDRFRVTVADSLNAAYEAIRNDKPQLVITDMLLPDGDGTTLLKYGEISGIPIIIMTSFGDERRAVEAIKNGAFDYIVKSVSTFKELPHTVDRVLHEWELLWNFFDNSPIAIWEEDFSGVKQLIDGARSSGVTDWVAYFEPHERMAAFASKIKIRDINSATLKLLGYIEKADVLNSLSTVFSEEGIPTLRQEFIALATGRSCFEGETVHHDARGEKVYVYFKLGIMPGYEDTWSRVLISTVDMSERVKAEQALMRSLAEKEILLQEVHHRVKNNLQVISSLINLQLSENDKSSVMTRSLIDMEARVRSMSLVHEILYQSEDFSSVELASYISSLCDHLLEAYAVDQKRVKILVSANGIFLPLEKAVPCGLLINELVVNALKHAFPDGRSGTIKISMGNTGRDAFSLTVSDDGIGATRMELEEGKNKSIGVRLVKSLSEQLGGQCQTESTNSGVTTSVVFTI